MCRQDLTFNKRKHKHKQHRQSLAVGVVLVCVGEVCFVVLCFEILQPLMVCCGDEHQTCWCSNGMRAPAPGACGGDR